MCRLNEVQTVGWVNKRASWTSSRVTAWRLMTAEILCESVAAGFVVLQTSTSGSVSSFQTGHFSYLFLSGEGWLSVNWTLCLSLIRSHTFTPAQIRTTRLLLPSRRQARRRGGESRRTFLHSLPPNNGNVFISGMCGGAEMESWQEGGWRNKLLEMTASQTFLLYIHTLVKIMVQNNHGVCVLVSSAHLRPGQGRFV